MQPQSNFSYERFVECLDERLQSANCKIWRKAQISATREVSIIATRITIRIVRVPLHLLVDYISEPTPDDFISFFCEGLAYSKRAFTGGGLKIFVSSFAMIPCIVCDEATPETIEFVTKRQNMFGRHFRGEFSMHGFDFFPVLYSLKNNEVYYWKGFDLVGWLIHPISRKFIEDYIVPTSLALKSSETL